jgi:thiol-disulfide isomerase/thioredoxin
MKKTILFILISFAFDLFINAQTIQPVDNCDSATITLTERVQGFGPKGNTSYGFGSLDNYDSTALLAYPGFKGLPDSITSLKKYCVILDNLQFYFQNYKKGIYSKEYLLEMSKGNMWNLDDTIYLTDKKIKNTISVIAGYDTYKKAVYMIDANNNGDFSDDTLRYLHSDIYSQDDIIANSYYVDYEFYDGKSVKKDKKLLNVKTFRGNNELDLSFGFPEMLYGKIKYGNKIYLICQESYNPDKVIYVLEDKPYFSAVGNKCEAKPNQYISLGNEFYSYLPGSMTPGVIKIKKVKISKDKFDEQIAGKSRNKFGRSFVPVSNQIGMIAPPVSGLNIMNDSVISLKKYLGKYVFLDFWATSCGPCIMEFPNILGVYEKFDHSNFEIIGVAKDDTKGKIQQFMKDKKVIWPNINATSPKTDISGYKINSYPTTYLIGPDGKIIATNLRGDDLMNRLELLKVKKK